MAAMVAIMIWTVSALAAEWIEIAEEAGQGLEYMVSALAAEWIEITIDWSYGTIGRSPPSRRSGLKLIHPKRNESKSLSPPSRRSGLKLYGLKRDAADLMSPPSRRSGLK